MYYQATNKFFNRFNVAKFPLRKFEYILLCKSIIQFYTPKKNVSFFSNDHSLIGEIPKFVDMEIKYIGKFKYKFDDIAEIINEYIISDTASQTNYNILIKNGYLRYNILEGTLSFVIRYDKIRYVHFEICRGDDSTFIITDEIMSDKVYICETIDDVLLCCEHFIKENKKLNVL